jgi:gliding motility-associated-like protein
LDTVWGISSTSYTYSPDITQGALTYSVAAFDSCYTPASPPTFQTSGKAFVHTTQFLETSLNICAYEVDLVWTPYIGWNAVASYEIWAKVSNQNWELVGITSNTTYTVSVIGLENYCFFIKAISDLGIVSFSNRSCLSIVAPTQPDFHYLKVATVVNNAVELRHLVDLSGGVTGIVFEKMNKSGVFETLVQLPLSSNNLTYVDTDVDVANYSYSYRARIIDSCGKPGVVSNVAKTILLSIQKDDVRNINYIHWTPYSEFDGEVIGYAVYRGIDGIFTDVPVTVQNSNLRSFEDDLSTYEFTGKVCYYVDAIEGSNVFNAPERARSNVACEVFEPLIYIPNAFLPDGINSTFQPVLTNFSPIDYRFTIFDRWGQAIYQTTSPEGAWDGTISFSGEMAETGSYIYMVVLHDGNGVEIVKRGFVTLLK